MLCYDMLLLLLLLLIIFIHQYVKPAANMKKENLINSTKAMHIKQL